MTSTSYTIKPHEAARLRDHLLASGPIGVRDISAAMGWKDEKTHDYIKHLDLNCVGFRRGSGKSLPLWSLTGKHIGGICENCGIKMCQMPLSMIEGYDKIMAAKGRSKVCRSCVKYFTEVMDTEPTACDPVALRSRPGSRKRVAELARRAEKGLELWNANDRVNHDDPFGMRLV